MRRPLSLGLLFLACLTVGCPFATGGRRPAASAPAGAGRRRRPASSTSTSSTSSTSTSTSASSTSSHQLPARARRAPAPPATSSSTSSTTTSSSTSSTTTSSSTSSTTRAAPGTSSTTSAAADGSAAARRAGRTCLSIGTTAGTPATPTRHRTVTGNCVAGELIQGADLIYAVVPELEPACSRPLWTATYNSLLCTCARRAREPQQRRHRLRGQGCGFRARCPSSRSRCNGNDLLRGRGQLGTRARSRSVLADDPSTDPRRRRQAPRPAPPSSPPRAARPRRAPPRGPWARTGRSRT